MGARSWMSDVGGTTPANGRQLRPVELAPDRIDFVPLTVANATTTAEAVQRWLGRHVHRTCAPKTIESYEGALSHFVAHYGAEPLHAVTDEWVEQHMSTRPAGSQAAEFSAISACFRWLDAHGHPGAAAAVPAKRPKSRQRLEYFTSEDYPHLWAALALARRQRTRRVTTDALMFSTLVPTRGGETCSLRWPECDLASGSIQLADSKTGYRWLPIGKLGASILAAQPRVSEYVFTPARRTASSHIGLSGLSHAFKRALRRYDALVGTNLARCCLHSLRHSWASLALGMGQPFDYVRRILGHTTGHMTVRYAHVLGTDLCRSVGTVQDTIADALKLQLHMATTEVR